MTLVTEFDKIKRIDILKHLIFKLGQDFNGNFYPNHIDFYICFGQWHTEKGCIYIAFLMLSLFVIDFIVFMALKIWYVAPYFTLHITLELLLIHGIKKENRFFILPHIIISSISITVSLTLMVFVICAIISPKNFFFHWVMTLFNMSDLGVRLSCLLFVLILGITVVIQIWVNWSLYVHYCYLRSIKIFGLRYSSLESLNHIQANGQDERV